MRKVLLAALSLLLVLPTISCDNNGGGGGETAAETTGGATAGPTSVAINKWVNAKGRSVPYAVFGLDSVSAGRGRALPEGLRVIVVTPPAHGTLSRSNTYYTPVADYVGEDFFTFKIIDASGKAHPQVYKITFKLVDAQPPLIDGFGSNWVFSTANQNSSDIDIISPGGVTMTFNSSSLTATVGTPVQEPTQKTSMGSGYWRFFFYGNFTGCAGGQYTHEFTATFTDPAGNTTYFDPPTGSFIGMVVPTP